MHMVDVRDQLLRWFWGVGSVIADPFLTLASILLTSIFVFAGARILVPTDQTYRSEITYESAVRVVAYGMTPAILAAVPFVGPAVAYLGVLIVTVIAARELYRISTGRAIFVALFPKFLFLGIILTGLFFFAAIIIKLIFSVF